jgi:hypothetical protein
LIRLNTGNTQALKWRDWPELRGQFGVLMLSNFQALPVLPPLRLQTGAPMEDFLSKDRRVPWQWTFDNQDTRLLIEIALPCAMKERAKRVSAGWP